MLIFNNVRDQYVYLQDCPWMISRPTMNSISITWVRLPSLINLLYSRPTSFLFVFVKDSKGQYTTDNVGFETLPGTIYFTIPADISPMNGAV